MHRAVITGTSSGIGLAVAGHFTARRHRVVGLARSDAPDVGKSYRHVRGDIRDAADRDRLVRAAGWMDVLVLNAGVCRPALLADDDAADAWSEGMDINLNGPAALLRRALPVIRPGGAVVAIASTLGLRGRSGYSAYCASKHGLIGLVRAAALELAPLGIRVNAICPGWTETPMANADLERAGDPRSARLQAEGALPLGRFVDPGEIAELVAFLASGAARSITGQAYEVSGGEGV